MAAALLMLLHMSRSFRGQKRNAWLIRMVSGHDKSKTQITGIGIPVVHVDKVVSISHPFTLLRFACTQLQTIFLHPL